MKALIELFFCFSVSMFSRSALESSSGSLPGSTTTLKASKSLLSSGLPFLAEFYVDFFLKMFSRGVTLPDETALRVALFERVFIGLAVGVVLLFFGRSCEALLTLLSSA